MEKIMQNKKINIKIDEKTAEGIYSNFMLSTFSGSEFILDFGRIVPGVKDVKIYGRILTNPHHAKQFLKVLQQNIESYEKKFGEIKTINQDGNPIGFTTDGQNS